MKHGDVPWFLMWCSALLFMFGVVWARLLSMAAATTVTIPEMPVRSALLVGAGVFGTILGQFGMLWSWRRYVRATDNDVRPVAQSTARTGIAASDEPSSEAAKKQVEERA